MFQQPAIKSRLQANWGIASPPVESLQYSQKPPLNCYPSFSACACQTKHPRCRNTDNIYIPSVCVISAVATGRNSPATQLSCLVQPELHFHFLFPRLNCPSSSPQRHLERNWKYNYVSGISKSVGGIDCDNSNRWTDLRKGSVKD